MWTRSCKLSVIDNSRTYFICFLSFLPFLSPSLLPPSLSLSSFSLLPPSLLSFSLTISLPPYLSSLPASLPPSLLSLPPSLLSLPLPASLSLSPSLSLPLFSLLSLSLVHTTLTSWCLHQSPMPVMTVCNSLYIKLSPNLGTISENLLNCHAICILTVHNLRVWLDNTSTTVTAIVNLTICF